MSTLRGFDRIDITDDVGDRHVGSRKLLDESIVAMYPVDLRLVAVQIDQLTPVRAQWSEWIVVDLGAGDDRDLFIEKIRELSNDSLLRLSAQTEKYEIMFRENRVRDLRHDRFVVAEDTGKQPLAAPEFRYEIRTHLVLDRTRRVTARP